MIPRDYITEWRAHAPWVQDAQVEHDLVISRALVELFRDENIASRLAFRGGTALHKLHLAPAARYSEDIDLVQVAAEPAGETLDLVRGVLDPWLGEPRRKRSEGRVTLVYRFESEEVPPVPLRLKIEINSREHFAVLGHARHAMRIDNRWFSGEAEILTFELDELLATKLRALYQRKKGRDLFDLWLALDRGLMQPGRLLECFEAYMEHGGTPVSRARFEANLSAKAKDRDFRSDLSPLLRPGVDWDFGRALEVVRQELVARLPGDPWRGEGS